VLAGYVAIACAYFGRSLLPHPGQKLIGLDPAADQRDPELFAWMFAWWPHAIASGINPFFTHAIYAPVGVNLEWTTSVPGLALAFSPLTILFGPVASFNVAQLLLPALSAWTAFLLCRYLTHSTWASVVGGYLFGFSSFALAHVFGGDLNLTGVFVVPLIALALARYLRGELGRRGLAWRLGLLLACQLWISTEVAVTLTFMLVAGLVLGLALVRDARRRIVSSLPPIVVGYAAAATLAAPLLVYAWKGPRPEGFANQFSSSDLLNLVLPTRLIALGGAAFASVSSAFTPPNDYERGLYLGLPALAIVLLLAIRARRSAAVRWLLAELVLAIVFASGSALHVDGRRMFALPWRLVARAGTLDNLEPARFALYAALASAVAVALWIGGSRGRIFSRPAVLPALAVAALVPAVFLHGSWARAPQRWPFFTDKLYELCIPKGETLAIFPFGRWGDSMLWQAESGFRFDLAEGDAGRDTYPQTFVFTPVAAELQFEFPDKVPTMGQLSAFAKTHRVDRFVSVQIDDPPDGYPTGSEMNAFRPVQYLGGVVVAPACGYDSLAGDTRRIPGQ